MTNETVVAITELSKAVGIQGQKIPKVPVHPHSNVGDL